MSVFFDLVQEPLWPYCAVAAWFVQMGIHEGMHAQVAYKLGDPTADFLGKRSVNPFVHIDWGNPMSWIVGVALPIVSVFVLKYPVPMGMAWVPINPGNFRRPDRDHALVSVAGPGGNFLLCLVCLAIHWGVIRFLPESSATTAVAILCCSIYMTSVLYGCFNLLPVPPLDGSRVLYWLGGESVRSFLDMIAPYGFILLFVLIRVSPEVQYAFRWIIAYSAVLYG